MKNTRTRCSWCTSEALADYHDEEWGRETHDDNALFELLVLEGAQAGLSWETVLKKRANYKQAFDDFDIDTVARYGEEDVERLLHNDGIIRNQAKIRSAIQNARVIQELRDEHGSFDEYIWQYAPSDRSNVYDSLQDMPAQTAESARMSRDLKQRGMKFVGPTICYSFMQATGMVDDHEKGCWRA